MDKKLLTAAMALAMLGMLGLAYADDGGAAPETMVCTHQYTVEGDYPGAYLVLEEDTVCTVEPGSDFIACIIAGANQDYVRTVLSGEEQDFVRCMIAGAEQDHILPYIAGNE